MFICWYISHKNRKRLWEGSLKGALGKRRRGFRLYMTWAQSAGRTGRICSGRETGSGRSPQTKYERVAVKLTTLYANFKTTHLNVWGKSSTKKVLNPVCNTVGDAVSVSGLENFCWLCLRKQRWFWNMISCHTESCWHYHVLLGLYSI